MQLPLNIVFLLNRYDSPMEIMGDCGAFTYVKDPTPPISIDEVIEASKNGTLQEVFGAGTAAVVSHVSKIQYKDTLIDLPALEDRKVGAFAKKMIDGMRSMTIEDKFGWIVPVKEVGELVA